MEIKYVLLRQSSVAADPQFSNQPNRRVHEPALCSSLEEAEGVLKEWTRAFADDLELAIYEVVDGKPRAREMAFEGGEPVIRP